LTPISQDGFSPVTKNCRVNIQRLKIGPGGDFQPVSPGSLTGIPSFRFSQGSSSPMDSQAAELAKVTGFNFD
jgi:hypothetical protein